LDETVGLILNPSGIIETHVLEKAVQELSKSSAENHYLIRHAMDWMIIRSDGLKENDGIKETLDHVLTDLDEAQMSLRSIEQVFQNKLRNLDQLLGYNKVSKEYTKSVLSSLIALKQRLADGKVYDIKSHVFETTDNAVKAIASLHKILTKVV